MADTTYTSGVTVLSADTANDWNRLHYTILSDPADAAAVRTALGLVIGTNIQAYDADLTTWAGVTPAAGVATFLATPSSANLAAALTDEAGAGLVPFQTTEQTWTDFNWSFSSGSATTGTSSATWTQTGKMVTVNLSINTASISSPTGTARIAIGGTNTPPLPAAIVAISAHGTVFSGNGMVVSGRYNTGPTAFEFIFINGSTGLPTTLAGANFASGASQNTLVMTATYRTA